LEMGNEDYSKDENINPNIGYSDWMKQDKPKKQCWGSALFFDVPEIKISTCNTSRENYNFEKEIKLAPKYQKHCKLKERSKLKTTSSNFYKNTPTITVNLVTEKNADLERKEDEPKTLLKSPHFALNLNKLGKSQMSQNCKTSRVFYPNKHNLLKDTDSTYFKSGIQDTDTRIDNCKNLRFPGGGWVCSQCQNYNFNGRKKCNRCKKDK